MFTTFVIGLFLTGVASGNSLSRIIGGTDTTIKAHPHQVSLQTSGSHICGASILNSRWVLTAAHCVDTKGPYTYTIGLNDGSLLGSVTYNTDLVIQHPDYSGRVTSNGAYPNDIALIKLQSEINFGQFGHRSIGLAASGQTFDGVRCTISGWGYTQTGGVHSIAETLQETHGTILTGSECGSIWGQNYNHNGNICIHNENTGSCSGDSGGPMVCNGVLAGVTSWGVNGCATDYPSVYARVSTYRNWIDATMANNN